MKRLQLRQHLRTLGLSQVLANQLVASVEGARLFETVVCTNLIVYSCRIIGFFFGFSLASAFAAHHLLDEYKAASAALQASVEELQASTEKALHITRSSFNHTHLVAGN